MSRYAPPILATIRRQRRLGASIRSLAAVHDVSIRTMTRFLRGRPHACHSLARRPGK